MQLCLCPQNPRRFKRSHSTLAVIRQTVGEGDCPVFSPFFLVQFREKSSMQIERKLIANVDERERQTWFMVLQNVSRVY